MSRGYESKLFCPLCPDWYDVSTVVARSDDPNLDDRTWADVMLRESERRGKSIKQRALLVSQDWKPHCPECGKLLPDTTQPVIIAIFGNYNSSKSHYLAALIHELTTTQPLRALGITVSKIPSAGVSMDPQINMIYSQRKVLPHTERGSAYGPYIYRLTRRSGGLEGISDLIFYDLAGEDAASHTASAKLARYVFYASGIILLLDPNGLPREGSALEAIDPNTRPINQDLVDFLAYLIKQATGKAPREREQRLVVAMAKADKLRLPASVYPPPTLRGLTHRAIRRQLNDYSQQCARVIADVGAESIVQSAYSQFGPSRVHFALVSATGEEPNNGSWANPTPYGCSLPIAQILLSRGSGA